MAGGRSCSWLEVVRCGGIRRFYATGSTVLCCAVCEMQSERSEALVRPPRDPLTRSRAHPGRHVRRHAAHRVERGDWDFATARRLAKPATMSSSATVVNCAPPDRRLTGYQGGGLARIITSNDIFPTESLVGRRGREQELQDRDEDVSEPQQRGIEAGLTAQKSERQGETGGGGGAGGTQDAVFVEGKGQEIAEEWTFPDGGWKAWSVIFVRCRPGCLDEELRRLLLTLASLARQGCWLYSCNVQGTSTLSTASRLTAAV